MYEEGPRRPVVRTLVGKTAFVLGEMYHAAKTTTSSSSLSSSIVSDVEVEDVEDDKSLKHRRHHRRRRERRSEKSSSAAATARATTALATLDYTTSIINLLLYSPVQAPTATTDQSLMNLVLVQIFPANKTET